MASECCGLQLWSLKHMGNIGMWKYI